MVSVILRLVKEFKIYILKSTKILIFSLHFLNVVISFNIEYRKLKLSMIILEMMTEGTVSQILYLGLSFHFM